MIFITPGVTVTANVGDFKLVAPAGGITLENVYLVNNVPAMSNSIPGSVINLNDSTARSSTAPAT